MNVRYLELDEAADLIGTSLVHSVSEEGFQYRVYPYPGLGQLVYQPELPTIIARWDGIAEDSPTEDELIRVPSMLRYEMRITNVSSYPPAGVGDAYGHAQKNVLSGTKEFFSVISRDRTLGGLVLDVGIEASLVADLVEPLTEEEFYGHQMTIVVKIFE